MIPITVTYNNNDNNMNNIDINGDVLKSWTAQLKIEQLPYL